MCTYWPIRGLIKTIIFLIIAIPKTIIGTYKAICFCGLFFKNVFILIHSEFRLLCGVDAAIGAVIGYFAGYVIVGLIVGGILGVLNYELISRRWLKLVPLPNK